MSTLVAQAVARHRLEVSVTTISLHDYLTQINQLLDESRVAEAVAHCRHILEKYPRASSLASIFSEMAVKPEISAKRTAAGNLSAATSVGGAGDGSATMSRTI